MSDGLRKMMADAGIPNLPTKLTHELRSAVSGRGDRVYEWSDKPHRLLYDACTEVEAQAARIETLEAALRVAASDHCAEFNFGLEVARENASLRAVAGQMAEALEWYGEQARLCRLIHSEGDSGRHALSADGGKRAILALSAWTAMTPAVDGI